MEVSNVIFERIRHDVTEYCAVTEYRGCSGCAFEPETLEGCQNTIGYPLNKETLNAYCSIGSNPHGVGIVWIKAKEVPEYIAMAVIHRMEEV
jgi:hypothetical protein